MSSAPTPGSTGTNTGTNAGGVAGRWPPAKSSGEDLPKTETPDSSPLPTGSNPPVTLSNQPDQSQPDPAGGRDEGKELEEKNKSTLGSSEELEVAQGTSLAESALGALAHSTDDEENEVFFSGGNPSKAADTQDDVHRWQVMERALEEARKRSAALEQSNTYLQQQLRESLAAEEEAVAATDKAVEDLSRERKERLRMEQESMDRSTAYNKCLKDSKAMIERLNAQLEEARGQVQVRLLTLSIMWWRPRSTSVCNHSSPCCTSRHCSSRLSWRRPGGRFR